MDTNEIRYLLDVVGLSALYWVLIVWLRRSRAHFALVGLALLGLLYLGARAAELELTAAMLRAFLLGATLVLLLTFHQDLRRLIERLGSLGRRRAPIASSEPIEAIVEALSRMANARIGALLVVPGKEAVERHMSGGIALEGKLSVALLESLFDPSSPGHDGAAVVDGERVVSFGQHLPLSTNAAEVGGLGTRHASALGLSERTDALCIAVSEERGTISIARRGQLRAVDQATLTGALVAQLRETPARPPVSARRTLARAVEALLAVGFAVATWLVMVPGATTTSRTLRVPIAVENLPQGYELVRVDPREVRVTASGPRRSMYLLGADEITAVIDAWSVELGRRSYVVTDDELRYPNELSIHRVEPRRVVLSVRRVVAPKGR